jgi:hypothetical protein
LSFSITHLAALIGRGRRSALRQADDLRHSAYSADEDDVERHDQRRTHQHEYVIITRDYVVGGQVVRDTT